MPKAKPNPRRTKSPDGSGGKHLVIVESPAKAKTIKRYLGSDFEVKASVGHVRDLPSKNPRGVKDPVPGVNLKNRFEPTYEVLSGKSKTVAELKRAAKGAAEIWFATDLDREGEAIAWHLAKVLGVEPSDAKRVIFNAVTKAEIQRAFEHPHPIDEFKVNAQQARRILDRIVGYQVSPLLWKKVARGLSAGRVQSVAVRLIVEREREIRAFLPDEYWSVEVDLSADLARAVALAAERESVMASRGEAGKPPTQKDQAAWLSQHGAFRAELIEIDGEKFEAKADSASDLAVDLAPRMKSVVEAVGLRSPAVASEDMVEAKGRARRRQTLTGQLDPTVRYAVESIETKRTTTRPPAPFITSTLQMAASSALGFGAQRTMRTAQGLYEGVEIAGEGQVGLITYMRTDSTHLSGEALSMARDYVGREFGSKYLPEKPNFFGSSNKAAQEAHEAIRPTDVSRHPDSIEGKVSNDHARLYRLIWTRFVACQMTNAAWDSTAVTLRRSDRGTGALLRATGRVLVFDGFYRVAGIPSQADEQTLPSLREKQATAPIGIDARQLFTSPPPRYTEASLVKKLESEGIGRPSTYASIIQVIQDRKYVEQVDRRFHATDLGEVVTDKLIEGFPDLMDVGYTREMEEQLDKIEDQHTDWVDMLAKFYGAFSDALERAHDTMSHAKAATEPAPYKCPMCGSRTCYRFGKNGRFLSCTAYPKCNYAAPINREGRPMLSERVNVACPEDGSPMELRTGRFGRFLASVNYPDVKFVLNLDKKGNLKFPAPPPVVTDMLCPKCGSPLNLREGKRGPWLGCSKFPKCRGRLPWSKVDESRRSTLERQLAEHLRHHPPIVVRTLDGQVIPNGTPIADVALPGGEAKLEYYDRADEAA